MGGGSDVDRIDRIDRMGGGSDVDRIDRIDIKDVMV